MATEIKKEPHRKVTLIILISLLAVFLIYYSVLSIISPNRKLEEIRREYSLKTSGKEAIDKILNYGEEITFNHPAIANKGY